MMEKNVPQCFQTLIKSIVYTFYQPAHNIIISTLIHHACLDEDTFLELLQMDRKQFRSAITNLRNDRIVKQTSRKEKDPSSAGTITYLFYYINHNSFLNALQYRLETLRKSMIKEEKMVSKAPGYQCQNCLKIYSEIEIPRIYKFDTDKMVCLNCNGEVIEQATDDEIFKSKSALAKFNEQFDPFFKLIEQCMRVDIPPWMADPDIKEDDIKRAISARISQGQTAEEIRKNALNKAKPSQYTNFLDANIRITIGPTPEPAANKPLPAWLANKNEKPEKIQEPEFLPNPDIMKQLYMHQHPESDLKLSSSSDFESEFDKAEFSESFDAFGEPIPKKIKPPKPEDTTKPSTIEPEIITNSPPQEIESDEFQIPKINVGGVDYEIDSVGEDIMKKMTSEENELYIKLLNEFYQHAF